MTSRAALVLLLIIGLAWNAFPLHAQDSTPPVIAPTAAPSVDTASTDALVQRADETIVRSDAVLNRVDLLMSFLEVITGIAALGIAVAAVLGITSLRDLRKSLRDDLDERFRREGENAERVRGELDSRVQNEIRELDRRQVEFDSRIAAELREIERLRADLDLSLEAVTGAAATAERVRAQGDRAIRALTLVQLGEQQLRDSNWLAAKRTFSEAYRLDEKNRAVNYFLGELYIMERDLDRAEFHLRLSLPDAERHTDPIDTHSDADINGAGRDAGDNGAVFPPAEAALAYVLRLKGDLEKETDSRNEYYASAERRFLKALRNDKFVRDINDESVYGMLGALYRQWGRIDDAIRAYRSASEMTPNRSYPLNNLAMLLYKKGDTGEATPLFLRAIRLAEQRIENNPLDYWAHFDRITGQLACTLTAEAERAFEEVLPIVQIKGPLESFRNGLNVMRSSGRNTSPMVEQFITRVEDRIHRLDGKADADGD